MDSLFPDAIQIHIDSDILLDLPSECLNQCEFGLHPGKVNPLQVYGQVEGLLNPDGSLISDVGREKTPLEKLHDKNFMISLLVGGGVIFVLLVSLIYYFTCVDKQ